ncbi:divalent-cation tolerance protein CutA [Stappia stellulata]|uniref:divalent-cation tolerance protein CutA n=1 Tax=Stappia stellulata TaxID=71235 RepID=UPI00048BB998|nr:divalent-cation tolerance protein CutA [Stappia stellulata]
MQSCSDIRLIYATFPDTASARAAAHALVGAQLAACVNMWPGMQSVYCWQGAVEEGAEVVFLAKTTSARLAEAMAKIAESHPFDEPAVIALDVAAGRDGFLDWIRAQTGGDEPLS